MTFVSSLRWPPAVVAVVLLLLSSASLLATASSATSRREIPDGRVYGAAKIPSATPSTPQFVVVGDSLFLISDGVSVELAGGIIDPPSEPKPSSPPAAQCTTVPTLTCSEAILAVSLAESDLTADAAMVATKAASLSSFNVDRLMSAQAGLSAVRFIAREVCKTKQTSCRDAKAEVKKIHSVAYAAGLKMHSLLREYRLRGGRAGLYEFPVQSQIAFVIQLTTDFVEATAIKNLACFDKPPKTCEVAKADAKETSGELMFWTDQVITAYALDPPALKGTFEAMLEIWSRTVSSKAQEHVACRCPPPPIDPLAD